jgi:hypothetical protein
LIPTGLVQGNRVEWHCRIAFCAQVEIGMAECCS